MPENLRAVSIGEMIATDNLDDVLVAYGLGSCVAVCIYDPIKKVGGMIHSLLPTANGQNGIEATNPAKYVDQGVPRLLDSVLALGAQPNRLVVRIAGGAQMLAAPGLSDSLNIGQRNALAAEAALRTLGLRVRNQDTGGKAGRTVKLYVTDGQVTVKKMGQGEQPLS
ncbi:MAG TPA: chemotaxis protein CheD [Anaerolineae bacterium]|nr:chemotaxis protein CheD [Anaerolineae bacterium]HMR67906.1 chemotaxis protein CheD [Anaerolineae bacterium]